MIAPFGATSVEAGLLAGDRPYARVLPDRVLRTTTNLRPRLGLRCAAASVQSYPRRVPCRGR